MTDLAPRTAAQPRRGLLSSMQARMVDPAALAARLPHQISGPDPADDPRALTASAQRIDDKQAAERLAGRQGGNGSRGWQEEAWELLDLIGEQRFLANTLAGRMSQARLYVGTMPEDAEPGTKPEPSEDDTLNDVMRSFGDGVGGQGQLLYRAGVNLFVAGEGWLVGIPPRLVPGTPEHEQAEEIARSPFLQPVDRSAPAESVQEMTGDDVLSLVWRMLSTEEVTLDREGSAILDLEDGSQVTAPVDALYLIRVWRPHPRKASEADSPTRASLPVLRELLGLTQMVGAQIDSRLAGAGILAVPAGVSAEFKRNAGLAPDDPRDPFMEALMEAMTTAIADRSSASATVPIVVTVPDASPEMKHLTFSTPLDEHTSGMRDEAIRRLALGQDAPPELLLGTGGMNHWGAWLVREDVVTTHLEPPLALIATALTEQFLRPVMRELDYSEDEIDRTQVWYDVDHLVSRPNRAQDAKELYQLGIVNEAAVRDATGFDDSDAPEEVGEERTDPAIQRALDMVAQAPSLVENPGIPAIVAQIREVLAGGTDPVPAAPTAPAVEEIEVDEEPAEGPPEGGTGSAPPADSPAGGAA